MEEDNALEENKKRTLMLFGRDLAEIPCFRNSWLYGITSGFGSGLLYFLFTSKTRMSGHVGFGSMIVVTMSYWTFCRYDIHKKSVELQKIKEYVDKKALLEATEMEKVVEVEVVNVSNTTKADV